MVLSAAEKNQNGSKTKLILASGSPRRRELIALLGEPFIVTPADADECIRPGETPAEYAVRVALDKARIAAARSGTGVVVAADTIVVLDGCILGKPDDEQDAERMLTLLSGRTHEVLTGLAVLSPVDGKTRTALSVTKVRFRALSPREINLYAHSGEPLDKAGAYGIQGKAAVFVESIEGCYFNVVGLPLSLLAELLKDFGFCLP
jgi:septum formation protein